MAGGKWPPQKTQKNKKTNKQTKKQTTTIVSGIGAQTKEGILHT